MCCFHVHVLITVINTLLLRKSVLIRAIIKGLFHVTCELAQDSRYFLTLDTVENHLCSLLADKVAISLQVSLVLIQRATTRTCGTTSLST